jgi:hypothetical protein
MRADIVSGAVLPDSELSDYRGKHRRLSELQGSDPLVLVLAPDDAHENLVVERLPRSRHLSARC